MCNITKGIVDSQTLLYRTPLGFWGSDLILVPPGSILTLEPSGMKIYCVPNDTVDWIQGPWNCEIENGGCEHQCEMCNGKPECICPPYMKLEENKVRCKNFTCKDSVCEYFRCENNLETHLSITGSIPESTTKHVKRSCSSAPCEHNCSETNDGYKCSCSSGFLPDPEKPQNCLRACTSSCPPIHDINDPSAFTCPKGFVLEEENCVIHDTCEKKFDCNKCTHIDGLNVCYCERGFFSPTRECDLKPFTPNITLGTAMGAATAAIVLILIGLLLYYCVHRKRAVSSFETTTNEQKMFRLLQVKTNR
ncbi:TRBM protein, partial [Atractosteus spatula]|nr:TRBM protein [Atractosteus spatula]